LENEQVNEVTLEDVVISKMQLDFGVQGRVPPDKLNEILDRLLAVLSFDVCLESSSYLLN
jgi:hypothetical protein